MTCEVTGHDAIPPAVAPLEAGRVQADELAAARIVEDRDRHPFAHHHEIDPAVAVHVLPDRVGHHADPRQVGRELRGDVREVAVAVVLEQHALGRGAVPPRHDAPAHEQIDVAIAVVVGRHDPRSTDVLGRQVAARLAEVPPPVVPVQPVLQGGRHVGELAPAAHDVQVGVAVAVRVEKHRAQVLRHGVLLENLLVAAPEPAVGLLNQQLPRLALRAPDEQVVEPVAVHVRHGDVRSLGRQQLGDEGFPVEIDEVVLPVHVRQLDAVGDVGEERRRTVGWSDSRMVQRSTVRRSDYPTIRLPYRDTLVGRDALRDAHAAILPLHRHRIDGIASPDAEGQHVVHARLEAARGLFLLEELLLSAPQRHLRADGEPIAALALELHLEVPVLR